MARERRSIQGSHHPLARLEATGEMQIRPEADISVLPQVLCRRGGVHARHMCPDDDGRQDVLRPMGVATGAFVCVHVILPHGLHVRKKRSRARFVDCGDGYGPTTANEQPLWTDAADIRAPTRKVRCPRRNLKGRWKLLPSGSVFRGVSAMMASASVRSVASIIMALALHASHPIARGVRVGIASTQRTRPRVSTGE